MKPLSTTIPVGWNADGWVQYLRTRAHSSDEHFPEVAAWFRDGADAVEDAQKETDTSIELIRAFRVLNDHPDDKGAKLNIRSLQKRLRVLLDRQNKEKEPTPGEGSVEGLKELPEEK